MVEIILFLMLAAFIIWINVLDRRTQHEWHDDPWSPCRLRRKINGAWQYRDATSEEQLDRMSREAW